MGHIVFIMCVTVRILKFSLKIIFLSRPIIFNFLLDIVKRLDCISIGDKVTSYMSKSLDQTIEGGSVETTSSVEEGKKVLHLHLGEVQHEDHCGTFLRPGVLQNPFENLARGGQDDCMAANLFTVQAPGKLNSCIPI